MKPLIILLIVFVLSIAGTKIFTGNIELALSGRIAMSAMLVFTTIGHFAFTKGMEMMLPDFVPFKKTAVYLTGIIEIAAAVGLLIPNLKVIAAWLLIIFFILILPANINAAIHHIDYQKGTSDGHGLNYLWFRVPLQVLFIVWAYYFAIKF